MIIISPYRLRHWLRLLWVCVRLRVCACARVSALRCGIIARSAAPRAAIAVNLIEKRVSFRCKLCALWMCVSVHGVCKSAVSEHVILIFILQWLWAHSTHSRWLRRARCILVRFELHLHPHLLSHALSHTLIDFLIHFPIHFFLSDYTPFFVCLLWEIFYPIDSRVDAKS